MELVNGNLSDLINNIDLIRKSIPEKADLTESEIIKRLTNRNYGIKLAKDNNSTEGIMVWYEDNKDIYLWLGVIKSRNKGIGTKMINSILESEKYNRIYAKVNSDNDIALRVLNKFGFNKYKQENNISYVEKII